jgi:hypothetical protein
MVSTCIHRRLGTRLSWGLVGVSPFLDAAVFKFSACGTGSSSISMTLADDGPSEIIVWANSSVHGRRARTWKSRVMEGRQLQCLTHHCTTVSGNGELRTFFLGRPSDSTYKLLWLRQRSIQGRGANRETAATILRTTPATASKPSSNKPRIREIFSAPRSQSSHRCITGPA